MVGPSGCGKSTLLAVLAGLIAPDAGEVALDGGPTRRRWGASRSCPSTMPPPWRTLLSHNVALAPELAGARRAEAARAARRAIVRYGLGGFEDHYLHALSGGMRQRGAGADPPVGVAGLAALRALRLRGRADRATCAGCWAWS